MSQMMGGGTSGGGSTSSGALADVQATDFGGFGMPSGGGGGDTSGSSFFTPQFDDPSNVVGDPFFDPMFGSQMMSGGGGQAGVPGQGPYTQDPNQQGSGGQQPQQQQEQQPTSAAGGPRQQQQGPLASFVKQLSGVLSGNKKPQGPSWIQPAAASTGQPSTAPRPPGPAETPQVQQDQQPDPFSAMWQNAQPRPGAAPQAPAGQAGGVAPTVSPPTPQVSPPAPAPTPAMAQQPDASAGPIPNISALPQATSGLQQLASFLSGQRPSTTGTTPSPAAATDTGAGAGTAPVTAAAGAAPDDVTAITGEGQGTVEGRQPPAAAEGTPQADIDYLRSRGAHSTALQGGRMTNTPYGSYYYNQPVAAALAKAGRDFERQFPGEKAQFGEGDRGADVQSVYRHRYRTGQGGIAAAPWASRHQYGAAMDVPAGTHFNQWLHQNAHRYGGGFPIPNDPNHFQMSRGYQPGQRRSMPFQPGQASASPLQQYAQAATGTATDATGGGGALPGSKGLLQPPQNVKWTTYAPGGGRTRKERRMEGGKGTSGAGLDGQRIARTLQDYRSGRSRYVSVAGPPEWQGQTVMIPTPQGPVPGYIHDSGDRFPSGSNKLDVAVHGDRSNRTGIGRNVGPQSALDPRRFDESMGFRTLNEQKKRRETKVSEGEDQQPFQVAGDVKPLRPFASSEHQDVINRLGNVYPGTRGEAAIDAFGGQHGPALDLMDVFQFPSGRPMDRRRSDLLNWLIQQSMTA